MRLGGGMFRRRGSYSRLFYTSRAEALRWARTTREELYYNTEEHFHEMPYKVGDRLPDGWRMYTVVEKADPANGFEAVFGWPSWERPARVTGDRACRMCRGRGLLLFPHLQSLDGYEYWVLHEDYCSECCGMGVAWEAERRRNEQRQREREQQRLENEATARNKGYESWADYSAALEREEAIARKENERRQREEACGSCKGSGQKYYFTPGQGSISVSCFRCGGTGKKYKYRRGRRAD
jgi:hypothetical protein